MKHTAIINIHFADIYPILKIDSKKNVAHLYNCKNSLTMFSEKIKKVNELENAAEKLIRMFPDERVFAFYGKMGAGKTTFIQAICRALGSDDNITSPTFALINEYKTASSKSIFHFDFYRIKNVEEAFDFGYEDYLFSGNYCLIEWPEMIEPLLPEKIVRVKILVLENESRIITAKNT